MPQLHTLRAGDRIALLYPSVGASRHPGTVACVTPTSVFVRIDGLLKTQTVLLDSQESLAQ